MKHLWRRCSMILIAVGCMLSVGARADALYILTGVEDTAVVLEKDAAVPDLTDSKIHVTSGTAQNLEVELAGGQNVTVYHAGASISAVTKTETVSELLGRLHITVGPLDMIGVDISPAGVALTIASELTVYERVSAADPAETIRQANPEMETGTEKVVQEGKDGTCTEVYEVVYSAGTEASRQLVGKTDSTTIDQIIEYGTAEPEPEPQPEPEPVPEPETKTAPEPEPAPAQPKEQTASTKSVSSGDRIQSVSKNSDGSGILTFRSGETMAFSSVRTMKATAYTSGYDGVGSVTATGSVVHVGTVAVDPQVIPLGTRMYIVTSDGSIVYGMAVALDTGIRGNKLDLYYDTYNECIQFGVRNCTVYILK